MPFSSPAMTNTLEKIECRIKELEVLMEISDVSEQQAIMFELHQLELLWSSVKKSLIEMK